MLIKKILNPNYYDIFKAMSYFYKEPLTLIFIDNYLNNMKLTNLTYEDDKIKICSGLLVNDTMMIYSFLIKNSNVLIKYDYDIFIISKYNNKIINKTINKTIKEFKRSKGINRSKYFKLTKTENFQLNRKIIFNDNNIFTFYLNIFHYSYRSRLYKNKYKNFRYLLYIILKTKFYKYKKYVNKKEHSIRYCKNIYINDKYNLHYYSNIFHLIV